MRTQTNTQISRNSPKTNLKILENCIRLKAKLWHDFPCTRITLRARMALRVMWNTLSGAHAFPGAEAPGRAAKIEVGVNLLLTNPKICSISRIPKMRENVERANKTRARAPKSLLQIFKFEPLEPIESSKQDCESISFALK